MEQTLTVEKLEELMNDGYRVRYEQSSHDGTGITVLNHDGRLMEAFWYLWTDSSLTSDEGDSFSVEQFQADDRVTMSDTTVVKVAEMIDLTFPVVVDEDRKLIYAGELAI